MMTIGMEKNDPQRICPSWVQGDRLYHDFWEWERIKSEEEPALTYLNMKCYTESWSQLRIRFLILCQNIWLEKIKTADEVVLLFLGNTGDL